MYLFVFKAINLLGMYLFVFKAKSIIIGPNHPFVFKVKQSI